MTKPVTCILILCFVALLDGGTAAIVQQNIGIVDDTGKACAPNVRPPPNSPTGCFDTAVLPSYARAIQDQINRDALPLWPNGVTGAVTIEYYPGGSSTVPKGTWIVHARTGTTMACAETTNAAGCHNQIDGVPYAQVVYHYPSIYYGHEILEMWADPLLLSCVNVPHYGPSLEEIVDPFASLYYIGTDNVPVNDFATPAWFGIGAGALDFGNIIKITAAGPGILPKNPSPPYAKLGFFSSGCQ